MKAIAARKRMANLGVRLGFKLTETFLCVCFQSKGVADTATSAAHIYKFMNLFRLSGEFGEFRSENRLENLILMLGEIFFFVKYRLV